MKLPKCPNDCDGPLNVLMIERVESWYEVKEYQGKAKPVIVAANPDDEDRSDIEDPEIRCSGCDTAIEADFDGVNYKANITPES